MSSAGATEGREAACAAFLPGSADAAVLDLAFALSGSTLPADHADALARAVVRWLPWFADEPAAGIHPLRAATTTHGMLVIAHRTKLVLRLPASRSAASRALCGRSLAIGGETVAVGTATERPLRPSDTLYSHRVVTGAADERGFHDDVGQWLATTDIRCDFIAGRPRRLVASGREILGFALALHGLTPRDSVRLQAAGMGEARRLGCGIFVPHKAIATASAPADDDVQRA